MYPRLDRWWPVIKAVLALTIVLLVGMRFANDLAQPELADLHWQPWWLLLSGLLYLVGIGLSGWYWFWLLRRFGESAALLPSWRAYYVSQLGKYVPGKALALAMRGVLVQGQGVRFGVAVIAAFYEVLTTMASGALVAALLFTVWPPHIGNLDWDPVFLGLLLVAMAGVPLLPAVFNRLVERLARRFPQATSFHLPRLRARTLLLGLVVTAGGWLLLGLSLWSTVQAVAPEPIPLDAASLARLTAMMSLSYVAGFMAVVVPGGVGVREFILSVFLPTELSPAGPAAEPLAVVVVLVLRLVWTAAEALAAAALYFWPGLAVRTGG